MKFRVRKCNGKYLPQYKYKFGFWCRYFVDMDAFGFSGKLIEFNTLKEAENVIGGLRELVRKRKSSKKKK